MVYIEIPRSAAWGCTALTDPSAIEAFRARAHEGFSRDWKPSAWSLRVKLVTLLANPEYYWHLGVTAGEVGIGLVIGGLSGLVVGIALGVNRLLARSYEPYRGPPRADHRRQGRA